MFSTAHVSIKIVVYWLMKLTPHFLSNTRFSYISLPLSQNNGVDQVLSYGKIIRGSENKVT
jgi:hypothetical protein